MHHVITTELFNLLRQRPTGVTMDVTTLSPQEGNYYAIGGFVQEWDGFHALAYRIVDDLPALLDDKDFFNDVANRVEKHWEAIKEHGSLGAWYANGELFIDVVEAWDCRCDEGTQHSDPNSLGTGCAKMAVRKGFENNQDAIGHVCERVAGGYETIRLAVA